MGNPPCKWARARLPLLVGDELVGAERRRVERHLIGCPRCRAHRVALGHALEVMHAAAAESSAGAGAPSLWPALARQIREAHRPAPARAFPGAALLSAFRPRFWLAFGLTLGLLVVLGVTVVARKQAAGARAPILADSPLFPPPALPPAPAVPSAASPSQLAQSEPAPEPAPAAYYDFDLEHGTPMGPVAVEGKTTSKPTY